MYQALPFFDKVLENTLLICQATISFESIMQVLSKKLMLICKNRFKGTGCLVDFLDRRVHDFGMLESAV